MLPAASLSASHCGFQVPSGAIVGKDGSVRDARGNVLQANIVCSYADVASGSSHGTSSNVQASAAIASPSAAIQAPNNLTIQEIFQGSPYSSGWYSYTTAIPVPVNQFHNPQPTTLRWYAGLLGAGTDRTIIGAGMQYTNDTFIAYAMLESASSSPIYSTEITGVQPGDTLVVNVQEAPTFLFWNASITDEKTGATRSITVQYDPAMAWAVDVMDSNGNPITACAEVPYFTDVHFGSPLLYPDDGQHQPSVVAPFGPGYYNAAIANGFPSCNWGNFVQADNGDQSGFADLIFGCVQNNPCAGSLCGPVPYGCTNDWYNCGGCPSGKACSQSAGSTCVASCSPKTCASQAVTCGSVSDGCGNTLECGTCAGTRSACVGGVCLCTAASCASLGATCGTVADGCGRMLTCGPACADPPAAPTLPGRALAGLALLFSAIGVVLIRRKELH
jgi:hypothetical protein